MKVNNLALSALVSIAAAQNGNDPLILNNRTGLAPVVYDTFITSYTKSINESVRNGFLMTVGSIPVTPSPVRSNTYLPKPTTSVECWRNGYPCGQNGGQRSQRLVRNYVRATPTATVVEVPAETGDVPMYMLPIPSQWGAAYRVPPPEFFSTRSDVDFPAQTEVSGETDDITMGILPIATGTADGRHYNAPPQRVPPPEWFSTRTDVHLPSETKVPGETGEAIFTALPIATPTPSTTESAANPSEWWRNPAQTYTIDCNRHYCPSVTGRPMHDVPHSPTTESTTLSAIEPTGLVTMAKSFAVSPGRKETIVDSVSPELTAGPEARAVPIDWWRGPGRPITPEGEGIVGPIQRHSISSSVAASDNCYRHYCPSAKSTSTQVLPTTMHTTSKPTTWLTPTGPIVTSSPVVPSEVSTLIG